MRKPIFYFVLMAIALIPGKIFVLMALIAIPGKIVYAELAKAWDGHKYDRTIAETAEQYARQVRPSLPKKIDEATTLIAVATGGNGVTYTLQVDTSNFPLSPSFYAAERASVTQSKCADPDSRKALNAGIQNRFEYQDAQGLLLTSFEVTKAHCKRIFAETLRAFVH
jgi:hypothetical protein